MLSHSCRRILQDLAINVLLTVEPKTVRAGGEKW